MKKLLVLLALCMVLAVVMVACETDPSTTDETTAGETTTEATTTEPGETTTEEVTTEPGTETSTEENTTEPGESSSEETTEPVEPDVDPADPVFFAGASDIAGVSNTGSGIAGAEVLTENGIEFVRITVNSTDPQFTVGSNIGVVPQYLAFMYRTTATEDAEMFIGTSDGPNGTNDHVLLDWNNDGNWHVLVVDLANSTCTNITDGNVGYFRLDPFRGATEGALDIAFIGFYNTPAYAAANYLQSVSVARDDAAAGLNRWSFDGFYINEVLYFEQDGNAADKLAAQNNIVPVNYGTDCSNIGFRGWVSFNQTVDSFGYFISGVTGGITFGEFKQDRPDLVAANIENGCGYNIVVPTADLGYGEYAVSVYAKLADGTIVQLYEITLNKINLTVDPNFGFATSIDQVNGNGPVKEDGSYEANFSAIGGNNTIGKIDAAATGKTTDKNGFLTLGGWCGINGGVNRYMWSVDGGNTWNEVISGGGAERADLVAHFGNIGLTDAATGAYAFSGTDGFIYIDLSAFEGATGTLLVGAIPNSDTNVVVPIAEISNLTIAPVVKTVYFNGENGTVNVPANFETKFFVRAGAAGMTLKIENADKFTITATNFADSFVMEAVDGVITVEVPADWDSFELTIVNNTAEAADAVITLTAPVVVEGDGSVDAPYVMAGTQGTISAEFVTGWESVFYTFTAEADGTLTFAGTENMWVMVEYENMSETVCDNGNGTWAVTAGTTYKFVIGEANWSAGTVEGTWSFAA